MRDQLLKSFADMQKRKLSSKDNSKNEEAKNKKKEVPKKDDKNTKNINPKVVNTAKPINPFIQNNKKNNYNTVNTSHNNQKQNQNNNTNSNILNNNKPKDKNQDNSNFKKSLNMFNEKEKDINKLNNNSNTNNNNKITNPTPLSKPELKPNNPERKVFLSRSTAITSEKAKEINDKFIINNFNNKIKNNNNEKKNLRTKSFTKINDKYKLEEDKSKVIKKSKSIKNEIPKINLNNFSRKISELEAHLYDDEINDTMNINEIQGKGANDKKNVHLKRAKTSGQDEKKEQQQVPVKKRYSLLDDNNCLTIKLKSKNNFTKDDFEVVTFSGKGAYGTVLQVYLIKDPKKKIYAIKKLDINSLFSVNRLYQAYLENDILNELDSPYIVKVYGAFESDGKIHLVMDYLPKGDFSYFIKSNFPLKEDIIRFYSAEMVLFLEYMQKMNLVHRDLKPQNIMIDEKGHLKVIDFGTVRKLGYYFDKREMRFKEEKIFERIDSEDIKGLKNIVNPDLEDADEDDYDDDDEEDEEEENEENENNELSEKKKKKIQKARVQRSMTFVGTAEYISPEVIGDKPAEFGTDIWAFGVMLYQMYFNNTPFKAVTTYLTFRNIEKPQISFPNDKISEHAKDLILKILVAEPKKRLGGGDPGTPYDIEHLKKHPFFKKIKWNNLYNTPPPGFKDLKYYECKKKSIYKNQDPGNLRNSDGYAIFDDKSKENAQIIKSGYIKKKSTWFHYEKRHIVLDASPKITLKAINDETYLRIIPLTKKCKITLVENNCFDLKTPEKTHRFKGTQNDGNDWAGVISDAINMYAK